MDGTKNLMVPRGEKSVWDRPSLSSSLSNYDQERWLMAAFGSALVMGGARRGGFGGGSVAGLGGGVWGCAGGGRHDLPVTPRRGGREGFPQWGAPPGRGGAAEETVP